jgi:hypothetical protein
MRRLRLRTPSPAFAVSAAALILALGGTSYAALTLPKNSVGTKQLKTGAVTGKKLHKGAVNSASIANGAVTGSKLNLAGVTVPAAGHASTADSATNAGHATAADSATNAGHANAADSATNAGHANAADSAGSAANATGAAGPLASGQTLIGYVDSAGNVQPGEIAPETSISFPIPLASAPALHIIPVGGPSTGACPGTASSPSAAGGNLCIYESTTVGTTGFSLPDGLNPVAGPTRFGLPGLLGASGNGDYIARGAWAVTAP